MSSTKLRASLALLLVIASTLALPSQKLGSEDTVLFQDDILPIQDDVIPLEQDKYELIENNELNEHIIKIMGHQDLDTSQIDIEEEPTKYQTACSCGTTRSGKRIVNGKEVSPQNNYPWAAIFTGGGSLCTAFLISPTKALTAGHCVTSGNSSSSPISGNKDIFFGCYTNTNSGRASCIRRRISTQNIVIHPNYTTNRQVFVDNDITVLKLNPPVSCSDKVQPACLPTKDMATAGQDVIAAGWGKTETGRVSENLRQTELKTGTPSQCRRNDNAYNPDTKLCTMQNDRKSSVCGGDSGGPLFMKNGADNRFYGVGITSYGVATCRSWAVFARVQNYLDWIESVN